MGRVGLGLGADLMPLWSRELAPVGHAHCRQGPPSTGLTVGWGGPGPSCRSWSHRHHASLVMRNGDGAPKDAISPVEGHCGGLAPRRGQGRRSRPCGVRSGDWGADSEIGSTDRAPIRLGQLLGAVVGYRLWSGAPGGTCGPQGRGEGSPLHRRHLDNHQWDAEVHLSTSASPATSFVKGAIRPDAEVGLLPIRAHGVGICLRLGRRRRCLLLHISDLCPGCRGRVFESAHRRALPRGDVLGGALLGTVTGITVRAALLKWQCQANGRPTSR